MSDDQDMVWKCDVTNQLAAINKLIAQNAALESSLMKCAKAAEQGASIAADAYKQQNKATRDLIEQNENLKKKLEEVKTKQEESGKGWEGIKERGVELAVEGVKKLIELQVEWNEKIDLSYEKWQSGTRALQQQMELLDPEFKKTMKSVGAIAAEFKVSAIEAGKVSSSLQSQGVNQKDAMGGVLKSVLQGTEAGVIQGDRSEVAAGLIKFVESQGKQATAKNIDEANRALAGAQAGGGKLTTEDFHQMISGMAAATEAGISPDVYLSEFMAMTKHGGLRGRQVKTQIPKIAADLKNITGAGQTALKAIGVDPDAIAKMQMNQAMELIGGQMKGRIKPEDEASFLKQISPAAHTALGVGIHLAERTRQTLTEMADPEHLAKRLEIGTTGVEKARLAREQFVEEARVEEGEKRSPRQERIANIAASREKKAVQSGFVGQSLWNKMNIALQKMLPDPMTYDPKTGMYDPYAELGATERAEVQGLGEKFEAPAVANVQRGKAPKARVAVPEYKGPTIGREQFAAGQVEKETLQKQLEEQKTQRRELHEKQSQHRSHQTEKLIQANEAGISKIVAAIEKLDKENKARSKEDQPALDFEGANE